MKAVKIIIAVVLAFASIKSCVQMSETEHGYGLIGVLLATLTFLAISGLLIYSALKPKKDKNKNL